MELTCPFSATLAKAEFACPNANAVIRRGGTEFLCHDATAHTRCSQFHASCKTQALAAFGLVDDLTQIPRSTLVKIQFGALLGLQNLLQPASRPADTINDINALLCAAQQHYGSTDNIPGSRLIEAISDYRLPRRRER